MVNKYKFKVIFLTTLTVLSSSVCFRMRVEMSFLEREASLCAGGVESAALLVWRHLEHFLARNKVQGC